jgi:hypothetical protein
MLKNVPNNRLEGLKYSYASQIIVLVAFALPKLSICIAYIRFFLTDDWGRRMVKGLIVILMVPLIPFIVLTIFQCKPINAYWTEGRPGSKCRNDILGVYINGGLNIFVDIALILIALPRILQLHLKKRQKWALVGVASLGFLAVGAGFIRIIRVTTTVTKKNFDAAWDVYDISIWTSVEVYVSLICASAPGIKPLITQWVPKLLGPSLSNYERTTVLEDGQAGSIELGSKLRRGTIGSARTRKKPHDSVLEEMEEPYTEVGRGVRSVRSDWPQSHNQDDDERRLPKIPEMIVWAQPFK